MLFVALRTKAQIPPHVLGEFRLCMAIFEDAYHLLKKYASFDMRDPAVRQAYLEYVSWFLSDELEQVHSFRAICVLAELNYLAVREKLKRDGLFDRVRVSVIDEHDAKAGGSNETSRS